MRVIFTGLFLFVVSFLLFISLLVKLYVLPSSDDILFSGIYEESYDEQRGETIKIPLDYCVDRTESGRRSFPLVDIQAGVLYSTRVHVPSDCNVMSYPVWLLSRTPDGNYIIKITIEKQANTGFIY